MGKLTKLDKALAFLKQNWQPMLYLALVAIVFGLLLNALVSSCQQKKTVYVLGSAPADTVKTQPSKEEQDIEAMWDSLKAIQP